MRKAYLAIAIAAGCWSTLSLAGEPAEDGSKKPGVNDRVCEDITYVGSRLAKKRICATRAEWEERRRQDRDAIDAAQRNLCVQTHMVRGANGNGHQAC